MLADIDGIVSTDELADMFCTTLVRNPWNRVFSYYNYLRAQGFEHPAVGLAKLLDFNRFMRDRTTVGAFRDWPYGAYMADAKGVERFLAFICIEHLEEDLQPFVQHLGLGLSIPIANMSEQDRDYRKYYDDLLAEFVGALYAEDIRRFGYHF